jgi:hypothetical protein
MMLTRVAPDKKTALPLAGKDGKDDACRPVPGAIRIAPTAADHGGEVPWDGGQRRLTTQKWKFAVKVAERGVPGV